ncbi:hypothetical protein SEA_STUFF_75 [Streptomyces phage Stuff]|nr:hypothetical protein SEA_CROSBY_77 [Streptomyces phage Crosby]QFG07967.1 hypothetical protein SEA_INTOLERANT_72 [Streptomyces phage Intolerant]UTN91906.1 hypothetical protein SEA_STUFF_75 [Streptomyces phage Stuff]
MLGYLTAWCQNPECGEEFALTESCDGEFCSWDCAERAAEIEDEEM